MNWSRLEIVGEYIMDGPFRIGNGQNDGNVLLDLGGRPLIPASTFRGALRSHLESTLRAFDSDAMQIVKTVQIIGTNGKPAPMLRKVGLCCASVDKPFNSLSYQGCLTDAIVNLWGVDPLMAPTLDQTIIDCTCVACRIFGTNWLRGRLQIADLTLADEDAAHQAELRGGITLSRVTSTMIDNSAYLRRAMPGGLTFKFRLLLSDSTPAEQGLIMLGLRAFEQGWVPLGADRARGLGQGHLEIDWWNCHHTDRDTLIQSLLNRESLMFTEEDAEARIAAFAELVNGLNRRD